METYEANGPELTFAAGAWRRGLSQELNPAAAAGGSLPRRLRRAFGWEGAWPGPWEGILRVSWPPPSR